MRGRGDDRKDGQVSMPDRIEYLIMRARGNFASAKAGNDYCHCNPDGYNHQHKPKLFGFGHKSSWFAARNDRHTLAAKADQKSTTHRHKWNSCPFLRPRFLTY